MKLSKKLRGNLLLILTAFIWGVSFVAQSVGMEYVGPFTFNATRFFLGGIVLLPLVWRNAARARRQNGGQAPVPLKTVLLGGFLCGVALFIASTLQQLGIQTTSPGKAGFITALYIVIVPLLGLFLKKKPPVLVWIGVALAAAGMALLCLNEEFSISRGDTLVFLCAVCFSFHILIIDHFSPKADGVTLSCIQFFVSGLASLVLMLVFETPTAAQIKDAWMPIAYSGVLSCGVAYTLQVVAQKDTDPAVASLLLSLESVFAVLGGGVLLHQWLSAREALGCVLVFAAIILAQIDPAQLRRRLKGGQSPSESEPNPEK